MRAVLSIAGAAFAIAVLAPTATAGDDDGNPVIGRAIFVRDNCSSCHGGLAGGGFGPNLRDDRPNDNEVEEAVLNGTRTGMPSYRGLLSRRDIEHLIEYFDTLRDEDEEPTFTNWQAFIPSRFPAQARCCAPPNEPPHTP